MNEIIFNNNSMPTINACDFCIAPKSFLHADRILDFNILIYVTEGCIFVTEDQIDYEIHSGELLFLKNGIRHFGKQLIPRGTKWHFVHFYMNAREDLPQFVPERAPIVQNTSINYSTHLPKKLSNLNTTTVSENIIALTEYFHSGDQMKKWNINARFFQLLTEIAFYTPLNSGLSTLSDQICSYLNLHYNEPFSSLKLEQHFFLSYKHMAAVFKREKQLTMQQYHTQIRMHTACKLLRTTLLPISKISEALGYTDMLYFSRCFHQFSGMSPTIYRKSQISFY